MGGDVVKRRSRDIISHMAEQLQLLLGNDPGPVRIRDRISAQHGGGIGLLRIEQGEISAVAGRIGIGFFAFIGVHRCHIRLDSLIAHPVGKTSALTRTRGKSNERRFDQISVSGLISQRALVHQNHRRTTRQFPAGQMISRDLIAAHQPVQHFLIALPIATPGVDQSAIHIIASPQRLAVGRTSAPHSRPMALRQITPHRCRRRNPLVGPHLLLQIADREHQCQTGVRTRDRRRARLAAASQLDRRHPKHADRQQGNKEKQGHTHDERKTTAMPRVSDFVHECDLCRFIHCIYNANFQGQNSLAA